LFIFLGVWQFFSGSVLAGIWIGFIGWFLLNAAQSADARVMAEALLGGVTVAQVMAPAPHSVNADSSLQTLVDAHLWPHGLRSLPVEQEGRLVGMIPLADVRRVPRDQWALTAVGQSMVPLERLLIVSPRQSLSEALSLMVGHDVNQLLVVYNG